MRRNSEYLGRCTYCGGAAPGKEGCGCRAAVRALRDLMLKEFIANRAKGGRRGWDGRPGWINGQCDPTFLLAELHDHAAKLHIATRELLRERDGNRGRGTPWGTDYEARVKEFGADVANVVLVLLDNLGLLGVPS